jgi:hypothetical protein
MYRGGTLTYSSSAASGEEREGPTALDLRGTELPEKVGVRAVGKRKGIGSRRPVRFHVDL